MKHRWRLIFLKVTMLVMLTLSLGGMISTQTAHASTCDTTGGFSICATGTNSVGVVTPHLSCSLIIGQPGGGPQDVMQGCNGSNFEMIGFDYGGAYEYVQRYGWAYSGTGDGERYFTFDNYTYFAPQTSSYYVTYSDGNEINNGCHSSGDPCDHNAWNNYIADYHSPTAQLRDWVDSVSRGGNSNNRSEQPLEYPQPGLANCKGSESGTSSQNGFTLGYTTNGGTSVFPRKVLSAIRWMANVMMDLM